MKVQRKTNIRVEVYPRSPGDFGFASIGGMSRSEQEELRLCEEIAQQIRRHVDELPSRGNRGVDVVYETETVCSHCGYSWEEDENGPLCCSKAQEEWDAEKANGKEPPR